MVKAIIFDWGGVIQRTQDAEPRRALERDLGLSPGGIDRAVFESDVWELASTGRCSADEAWETIAAGVGWPLDRLDEFVERFFAGDLIDPELVALIRMLRARGLPVALLSNAPPGRRASASAAGRWGMGALFTVQVFSYEVGALKPDPRMYHAVLTRLGVAPEEALFIDDAPANIEGAQAIGLDAILFTGMSNLLASLGERGVPVP